MGLSLPAVEDSHIFKCEKVIQYLVNLSRRCAKPGPWLEDVMLWVKLARRHAKLEIFFSFLLGETNLKLKQYVHYMQRSLNVINIPKTTKLELRIFLLQKPGGSISYRNKIERRFGISATHLDEGNCTSINQQHAGKQKWFLLKQ